MAKVKEIHTKVNTSVTIKDVFYSFSFGITLEVEEGDDTAKIKQMAWDTCHVEVEKQVEEVINDLK